MQQEEEKEEKEVNFVASKAAQLLGIRGAGDTADKWKIRLQLTKPVTWVPLIWGELPRDTALHIVVLETAHLHAMHRARPGTERFPHPVAGAVRDRHK